MAKLPSIDYFATKVPVPLAVLGPAALFAFMWKWLNAPLVPYIGEGATGPGACLLGGLLFYVWMLRRSTAFLAFFTKTDMQAVGWYLFAAAVGIPGGRVLFSFIPPFDNSLGAVLGVVIAFFVVGKLTDSSNRFMHVRGTIHLTADEARLQMARLPIGSEPQIRWAGYDLPGEVGISNFLAVGARGTGKTRTHRELLRSLLPHIHPGSDRRALIYDVKGDLLSELYGMKPLSEVLVFNPFDQRSVAWDIAADVSTDLEATQFSEVFIPPPKGEENPFFASAAQNVVAGVIKSLNSRSAGKWTLRDLLRITATKQRLERVLAGSDWSDLIDQFFSPQDTFDNVRNTIANVTVKLETIGDIWERTPKKVSLREWVRSSGSILVLGGKENLQSMLQPLNRITFDLIITDFLSEPDCPLRSRLWFFCDELKTAGRLVTLPNIINGRSKGIRCVLGFQEIEGLVIAYGSKDQALEVINPCGNIAWYKIGSPVTAQWASERSGEFERFEYLETQTKDGTSVGEHLVKRESVIPSEFLNLPFFSNGNATGIHTIAGVDGVFRDTAHYDFPTTNPDNDFLPRPKSDMIPIPWTEADMVRLGFGGTEPPTTPSELPKKLDDPNLDSLGRVSF